MSRMHSHKHKTEQHLPESDHIWGIDLWLLASRAVSQLGCCAQSHTCGCVRVCMCAHMRLRKQTERERDRQKERVSWDELTQREGSAVLTNKTTVVFTMRDLPYIHIQNTIILILGLSSGYLRAWSETGDASFSREPVKDILVSFLSHWLVRLLCAGGGGLGVCALHLRNRELLSVTGSRGKGKIKAGIFFPFFFVFHFCLIPLISEGITGPIMIERPLDRLTLPRRRAVWTREWERSAKGIWSRTERRHRAPSLFFVVFV